MNKIEKRSTLPGETNDFTSLIDSIYQTHEYLNILKLPKQILGTLSQELQTTDYLSVEPVNLVSNIAKQRNVN